MTREELICEIENNYWMESRNIVNYKKVSCSPVFKDIKDFTSFLDEASIPERFYCVKNKINSRPICTNPNCNNYTRFVSGSYRDYCSDSCYNQDIQTPLSDRLERYEDAKLVSLDSLKDFLEKNALSKNKEIFSKSFSKGIGLTDESSNYLFSIMYFTSSLNKSASIIERVYCILNDIKEPPKCISCGNNFASFSSWKQGYSNFCSQNCLSLDKPKKVEDASMKKHDVDNVFKSKSFKEKYKATMMKKHGVDNFFKSKSFKENHKDMMMKKYGVDNPSKLEEVKKKKQATCMKNWGTPYYHQSEASKASRHKRSLERRTKQLKKIVEPLFEIEDYEGSASSKPLPFRCVECGYEFVSSLANGNIPRCYKCYPKRTTYFKIEKEISEWLTSLGFLNVINKKFYPKNSKSFKEIDIYIPSKQIGIEINGIYWHSEIGGNKDRNYHKNKQDFFKERDICLLQFLDKEWCEKKSIVKSIILSKLGFYEYKVGARNCNIKIVSKDDCIEFLEENHLQGSLNNGNSINVGLYYNNALTQVLTLSKSRFNKSYEYEITRFATLQNYQVMGGFSKLLNYVLKTYKIKSIITYAEYRFSTGEVYKKNGFSLVSSPKPNYFYIYKKNYNVLFSRYKFQKHKLPEILDTFDKDLSEWENMKLNNYDRIWDCGSFGFSLKL